MRKLASTAIALSLFLTLTACPGSMTMVRPQLGASGVSAMGLTFTSRSFYLGRGNGIPMGDPSRITPFAFSASRYTLKAGDEVIWQIERDLTCVLEELPADIIYGVAPHCFNEVVPAKPLERGRSYRLQGNKWESPIDFTYDDPIQLLSNRGYAVRTRKWRNAHP